MIITIMINFSRVVEIKGGFMLSYTKIIVICFQKDLKI